MCLGTLACPVRCSRASRKPLGDELHDVRDGKGVVVREVRAEVVGEPGAEEVEDVLRVEPVDRVEVGRAAGGERVSCERRRW